MSVCRNQICFIVCICARAADWKKELQINTWTYDVITIYDFAMDGLFDVRYFFEWNEAKNVMSIRRQWRNPKQFECESVMRMASRTSGAYPCNKII